MLRPGALILTSRSYGRPTPLALGGSLQERSAHRARYHAVQEQLDHQDPSVDDGQQLDAPHGARGGVGDEVVDHAGAVTANKHLERAMNCPASTSSG